MPTRTKASSHTVSPQLKKQMEKDRVDAFLSKGGHGVTKSKVKPKLTPAQIAMKKSEENRKAIMPKNPMDMLRKSLGGK